MKPFLNGLNERKFNIIIPKYNRKFLEDWFKIYKCEKVYCLQDNEELILNYPTIYNKEVKITLFVEDCEMNRDSGLLISIDGKNIYNGNDCKYHDISKIKKYGNVDVLCQQYSGATWHPICYDYHEDDYDRLTLKKENKKNFILKYLDELKVKRYIPCAGPPVFLDPELIHISKNELTIFPRADWIRDIVIKGEECKM